MSPPRILRVRPVASEIGLVLLQVLTVVPLATAIASLFGFGAVILLAWRSFRRHDQLERTLPQPMHAPSGA